MMEWRMWRKGKARNDVGMDGVEGNSFYFVDSAEPRWPSLAEGVG